MPAPVPGAVPAPPSALPAGSEPSARPRRGLALSSAASRSAWRPASRARSSSWARVRAWARRCCSCSRAWRSASRSCRCVSCRACSSARFCRSSRARSAVFGRLRLHHGLGQCERRLRRSLGRGRLRTWFGLPAGRRQLEGGRRVVLLHDHRRRRRFATWRRGTARRATPPGRLGRRAWRWRRHRHRIDEAKPGPCAPPPAGAANGASTRDGGGTGGTAGGSGADEEVGRGASLTAIGLALPADRPGRPNRIDRTAAWINSERSNPTAIRHMARSARVAERSACWPRVQYC